MAAAGVGPEWRASSYSSGSGQCVELATNAPGVVPVRDSKRSDEAVVVMAAGAWGRFVAALRNDRIG